MVMWKNGNRGSVKWPRDDTDTKLYRQECSGHDSVDESLGDLLARDGTMIPHQMSKWLCNKIINELLECGHM